MCNTGKITQDYDEAVREGDGNAEPVIFRKSQALPENESGVEDIVVGRDHPFWEPGGAARVLIIDGIVAQEPFTHAREYRP